MAGKKLASGEKFFFDSNFSRGKKKREVKNVVFTFGKIKEKREREYDA